jgi:hypothetical protein
LKLDESLKKATRVMNKGAPINMATRHFGIPTSLKDHLNKKEIDFKSVGKMGDYIYKRKNEFFIRC